MGLTNTDVDALNNAEGVTKYDRHYGHRHMKLVRCVFDTAANDSAGISNKTIAAHGLGLKVPAGTTIVAAYYKVLTTFTSATDAATIALKVEGAGDLVAAVAISDAANPWDASTPVDCVPVVSDKTKAIDTTVEREVTATVAVEALTAGKLVLWLECAFHGDV